LFRVGFKICVGVAQSFLGLIHDILGLVRGCFRCYLELVQGFFRLGLEIILGWFKALVGLVSRFFKVGLVIYFWLVQGWFRIYAYLCRVGLWFIWVCLGFI